MLQDFWESVRQNLCTQHLKLSQGDAGFHTHGCHVAFIQCSPLYIFIKQGWMYSSPLKFSTDEMVQDHTACRVCTDLCSQQLLPSQCVYNASFSAHSSGEPEGYLQYLQKTRNKSQHSLMGNTVRQVLLLDYLFEDSSPKLTYTKGSLLSLKPTVPSKPQLPLIGLQDSWTIPQSHSTLPSKRRTGRRIRIQTSSGNFVNFKPKNKPPQRGTHNSIIHKNSTTTGSAANSASQRHAGSPFWASEARPPPRGGGNIPLYWGPGAGGSVEGLTEPGVESVINVGYKGRTPF